MCHLVEQDIRDIVVDVCPRIDDLVVTLVVGDETHVVIVGDATHLLVTFLNEFSLLRRYDNIVEVERQTGKISHAVTQVLDTVEELARLGKAYRLDDVGDDVTQRFLRDNPVDVTHLVGDDAIDDDTTDRGLHDMFELVTFSIAVINEHLHLGMQVAATLVVGDDGLFGTVECQSLALGSRTNLGDIVQTEHHVLRRHGDRSTVGRVEDVVALEHENLCLEDSLVAQRQVNSHLVAVEVGIERRTCQRVQLNSLALDKFGLESLDTQTVQCRSTVEEHGMTFHHVLEDVPDDRFATVDDFLRRFHCLDDAALDKFADDEWLI